MSSNSRAATTWIWTQASLAHSDCRRPIYRQMSMRSRKVERSTQLTRICAPKPRQTPRRRSERPVMDVRPTSFRSSLQLSLPLLEFLRHQISIVVPSLTVLLELFSVVLLFFTWSSRLPGPTKSTLSTVLPQAQYQPCPASRLATNSSRSAPIAFSYAIASQCTRSPFLASAFGR